MSTYHYQPTKLIDEVVFKETGNGALRSYLHAREGLDDNSIKMMMEELRAKEWECIPFTLDGKPYLEVRGFSSNKELLGVLNKQAWVEGKPDITKAKEDQVSWMEMFRKRSMQASGAAMMVADVGFAMYGAKEKSWEDTLAGLSYLSGSATLLAYGRNDQSQIQIREVAESILEHAQQNGYKISDESAAASVGMARNESAIRKVNNFFQKYPSEIGNMMYVSAGALIAKSALQHRALATPRPGMSAEQISKMRMGGWGDTALGATTVGSGLLATLVKEKAHDPDAPKKYGLAGIAEWIQESPLRIASYGYMGSTLCHAVTTFIERKEALRVVSDTTMSALEHAKAAEKLKAIPWRVLFVSATLVGEFLLSISSKGHGEGVVSDKSVDSSAMAIAADLIVKQPVHMQDQLIEQMGKFLGDPKVLAMKDSEAIAQLRKQVEIMRKNPWAQAEDMPSVKSAAKPVVVPSGDKKSLLASWQAKVTPVVDAASPQFHTSA